MTPPAPPRRRWFSYSLRTFFVLLTLVAFAIHYAHGQWKWLHARRAFLAEHDLQYGIKSTRAPGLLWACGESGVTMFLVYSKREAQLAKQLFPEAGVYLASESFPNFEDGDWYMVTGAGTPRQSLDIAGRIPGT